MRCSKTLLVGSGLLTMLLTLGRPAQAAPEGVACPDGLPAGTECRRGRDGNGAYYWIAVPKDWNGTLVVHSHGGPRLGAPKPDDPVEDLQRFAVTVSEGYAWAGSSYRRGGYGVRMAAEDTENLRKLFVAEVAKPKRTFIHGQSWGGNVAAKAIELYPGSYDGALLTSGVLAGGTEGYGYRTDLRAVYQYYCHNHPGPDEPQYPLNIGLPAGQRMTGKELAERVEACTGAGKPAAERSPEQARNLAAITAVTRVPERTLVSHMNWATFLYRDIVAERLGGRSPFGNEGVRYTGSADDAALNAGVARLQADPQAVAELAEDSDLTGKVTIPTLTLHAIDDPTAFVEHESHYRAVREKAGTAALLVQTFTREHVHSKLHTPEYAAAFAALSRWVDTKQAPEPAAIAASCEGYRKAYPETCLFDPAFHPAPYDSRVYPRDPAGKG
ncbi:alpha/beta hydrolase family protein [Roseomonas mucosa]